MLRGLHIYKSRVWINRVKVKVANPSGGGLLNWETYFTPPPVVDVLCV